MVRRTLLTVATLLLLLPTLANAQRRRIAAPPPKPASFDEWLQRSAIRFDTTEPREDYHDLLPLRDVVGSARLVGLGEATHGSAEFQTMKDRLLRYLVEDMGFTVFAMEASIAEADDVNAYVQGGPGNAADLIRGMFLWPWCTTEMVDLVEWMRAYNVAHPAGPQLSFRGFDMQFPVNPVMRLDAYLIRVDPAGEPALRAKLDCMSVYPGNAYEQLPAAQKSACRASVAAAYDALAAARPAYVAASSAAEYERMLRYARVVVQAEDLYRQLSTSGGLRDQYMGENAIWMADVEHPGEKLVLWAHNGHIQSASQAMGAWLKGRFNDDYRPMGFLFDHGDYTARDTSTLKLGVYHVNSAPSTGFEHYFRAVGQPRLIADLRAIPPPGFRALYDLSTIWSIGGAATKSRIEFNPYYYYDVLIWIEEVHATHLLPLVQ